MFKALLKYQQGLFRKKRGDKMELKHIATRSGRLSGFLREEMGMSAGLMNRLKWKSSILVNDQPVFTDHPVQVGDIICVLMDEPAPEYPAEDMALTILYEDDHLLAVDKPAGMLIHPSRSCNIGTLANGVAGYYQRTGQSCAFHPVTRLDRDTFGIVLLAKNSHIHNRLQAANVEKIYHALVYGGPEMDAGRIDAPIARKPLPSLLREISPEGKPSVTEFTVLERSGELALLALRPITGRTHQLRLHCAHMGYPILGDPQYGSQASQQVSARLGLLYQQLCARELRFAHPMTGETLCLQSNIKIQIPY